MDAVDRLGAIKAQIANLRKEEAALIEAVRQQILADDGGPNYVEGALFRAVLSVSERIDLDVPEARALLPQDRYPQLYRSTVVTSLNVRARKTS
jgi:hypothetical protein